ncbi:MAG: DUF4226 domain-containing protein [Mycolicibacterium sp.]|uniref:DUF4226 domain-containing protein n=1 Tax=Mycolicibacterium sp. TaxID=2320850 RepID=UPI003D0E8F06
MASYDDLRNVLDHIADKTGDADGWQQGLTPQQIRDVSGWLASDGAGFKGYKDPETGIVYDDRSGTNTSVLPAVPDEALDRIRQTHWQLFDPQTKAPVSPGPEDAGTPADTPAPRPTSAPGQKPPEPGGGLGTEEENSGRTTEAIKKVQAEMSDRQSQVREADAKLAEVMLSAHANSAEGLAAIQQMQKDIVAALNDPNSNLDTPAGELQFLKFLREKAESAKKLVDDGKLTSADQAKMALALAEFYQTGSGRSSTAAQAGDPPGSGGDPAPAPPPSAPVDPGLYPSDPALLGPPPEMPGDLGPPPQGLSPLTDTLGAAAPLLSGLGSPLAGGIPGSALDLGAVTRPIGDAIAAAADRAPREEPNIDDDELDDEDLDDREDDEEAVDEKLKGDEPGEEERDDNAAGEFGEPPAPAAGSVADSPLDTGPPPPPSLDVDLRDGSQVTAADPARAEATRALLTGTPYGEALRQNTLSAPPPGTTLTNYLAPNQLQPGDYAMYPDKLVGVLGPDKFVGADGRIEPLTTLPQDGFLGFGRPTLTEGAVTPGAPKPTPSPAEPASEQQPQQGVN